MKKQILAVIVAVCVSGCTTSQTSVAIKSEGVIITTVDLGMKAWAQWVNTGHASAVQVNNVENAYNAYYTAQETAEAALLLAVNASVTNAPSASDIQSANAQVATAEGTLLTLLNQYITPTTTK